MARWRLICVNAALILLGLVICLFWIYFSGGSELLKDLKEIPSGFIIVLPAITGYWILARFIRWQYLLRRFQIRIPIRGGLLIYLASLPGIATPAYIGEMIRSIFMRQKFGIPIRFTILAIIIERLLDFAGLGVIALVTSSDLWLRNFVILGLILIYLIIIAGRILVKRIGASKNTIDTFQRGDTAIKAFTLSILIWLPTALLIPLAALSIHVLVPPISGIHIYSTATILGGITLMPAGFGVTGSLSIIQLQNIGISLTIAVLIVSLVRLMSTGLSLMVGTVFLFIQLRLIRQEKPKVAPDHFDEIAKEYGEQFSPHIWNHLLDRKLKLITSALPFPPSNAGIGLDVGCGLGIQCREMNNRGYQVVGMDPAYRLIEYGKMAGATVFAGDALNLPFKNSSFDFVYLIGVMHHLSGFSAQEAVCNEVIRILRPGGFFIVIETNPRNPLFRFYMGYIFPIVKSIDEGTEYWIETERWGCISGIQNTSIQFFTFLPDFVPHFLMGLATTVERALEASIVRSYSVHYAAILQKANPE